MQTRLDTRPGACTFAHDARFSLVAQLSWASRAANYFGTEATAVVSAGRRRLCMPSPFARSYVQHLERVFSAVGAQATSGVLHNFAFKPTAARLPRPALKRLVRSGTHGVTPLAD